MNTKKKYISFSLWGSQPIYNIGAIRNLELAKIIYPDWKIIFYYDVTVPLQTIEILNKKGAILVLVKDNTYGMFWRFNAADLPDCEYAIFRDTDSRLTLRERKAVDEWIASNKILHVMRDHPFHEIPFGADKMSILGGMWGIKGGVLNFNEMINEFHNSTSLEYGSDQTFLMRIYEQFSDSVFFHDEFFAKKKFPIKRHKFSFIGERIDENENPVGDDRHALKQYYLNRKFHSSMFKRILKFLL